MILPGPILLQLFLSTLASNTLELFQQAFLFCQQIIITDSTSFNWLVVVCNVQSLLLERFFITLSTFSHFFNDWECTVTSWAVLLFLLATAGDKLAAKQANTNLWRTVSSLDITSPSARHTSFLSPYTSKRPDLSQYERIFLRRTLQTPSTQPNVALLVN